MQSVDIKAIERSDFDIWLMLWESYQRFYKVTIPKAVTRDTWERFFDPNEPMHAVLALACGQPCGFAHTVYHRSTWTTDDYCYLQDLFVATDARGRGVGRALIEHVYAEAKHRKAPRVHWLTHETNYPGRLLYDAVGERSGFIQYRKVLA
ncbi:MULTISPECIES: GNAT family N-acetyltransferase [unclassified Paraburkholderia]|uniref:GNAT family N-acetyltransferase n=1 Tax=unclassified Paraburkholderia TaxID=2615204 RepID=UPI002AB74DEA|nr:MULTISPECIES: GNAT family N-acetyltransferase [unclassified Paraburkholderia]